MSSLVGRVVIKKGVPEEIMRKENASVPARGHLCKGPEGAGVGQTSTCGWITRVREAGGEW